MALTETLTRASAMGARAADTFITSGVPTPNPFPTDTDLASAWRAAYFAAFPPPRTTT